MILVVRTVDILLPDVDQFIRESESETLGKSVSLDANQLITVFRKITGLLP